jgi:integrase
VLETSQKASFPFATDKGTALDTRNVTRYLQRHLARLGLPHQRFHDLRHAFATLMIESGEDLGAVSRILGTLTSRQPPTSTRI